LQAAESAVRALLGEAPDVLTSTPSAAPAQRPTVVLNQLRPGTTYTSVVREDPTDNMVSNGKPLYSTVCVVDGEKFEGTGKKMSKALAADAISVNSY